MDNDTRLRFGEQADAFLKGDFGRWLLGDLRADALNAFARTKPSDTEELVRCRLLLGAVDLLEQKIAAMRDNLSIVKAERAEKEKKLRA